METIAFGVAVAALAVACYTLVKLRKLTRGHRQLQASHSRALGNLNRLEENLTKRVNRLNYALREQSGRLRFREEMTFEQALAIDPRVEEVMAEMHVGGCPDCAVDVHETLAAGAARNGVNVLDFLSALNALSESEELVQPKNGHAELRVLK
ncbi:MAG: hypothetical protein D6743_04140 [Calditrichaeota bacterium]|nr:MAG: hypothetical protein D6743_04140 [Calditrichota bacterium]